MTRPLRLGHRGARAFKEIPENTLPSFDRALADGCDGFEFDVRLTADGQAVVCHDPVVHDAKAGRLQIAQSRAGQLPDLPRLGQILSRYKHSFLDVELKVCGLEEIVIENVKRHRPKDIVLSSFLPEVLKTIHRLDADLPLGLICETKRQLECWSRLPVQYVIPHHKIVRRDLICELHDSNRRVLVWTVNRPRQMERLAAWRVDGIISDDTKLLGQTLAKAPTTETRSHGEHESSM